MLSVLFRKLMTSPLKSVLSEGFPEKNRHTQIGLGEAVTVNLVACPVNLLSSPGGVDLISI